MAIANQPISWRDLTGLGPMPSVPSKGCMALLDSGLDSGKLPKGVELVKSLDFTTVPVGGDHARMMAEIAASAAGPVLIASLRVLDRKGDLDCPETLELALRWLCENHRAMGIRVVLLPVATVGHHKDDSALRQMPASQLIADLVREGISIICPAGNFFVRFFEIHGSEGMAWPGILREVTSVGAVTQRLEQGRWIEVVAPHSQRLMAHEGHPGTTVFAHDPMAAPTDLPGPVSDAARTSGAAALLAGYAMRWFSCRPNDGPEDFQDMLRRTALSVSPARRGLRARQVMYPALRALTNPAAYRK